jgi:CubicO group peptidase (beta-lactamase class C family)
LLFTLLMPWTAWAKAPSAGDLAEKLDAALHRAVKERRVVGCVVLVAHQGNLVYSRAAGLQDLDNEQPMQVDTLFRLASVTKPLVSTVAMRLVQEGRLSLDDPVSKWLPDFRPALAGGHRPEITVHQLLTHTSGLSYRFGEPNSSAYNVLGVSDGLDNPGLTLVDNLARLAQAPLGKEPGSAFTYSLSTDVLGAVIEKVTAKSLPESVDELLLRPLRMRDTGFFASDSSRLASPYCNWGGDLLPIVDGTDLPLGQGLLAFTPSKSLQPPRNPSGGGGMVGSAEDFHHFLEVIRRGGSPVLDSTTVNLMTQDHLGALAGHREGWGFGYGWAVLRDPEAAKTPQTKGTLQWGGAYGHSWFIDPAAELTVVVFSNTAFEGMSGKLPSEVRSAVYLWLSN